MTQKRVSRRNFLRMTALTAAGVAMASCQPSVVKETVKETVEVVVKETVEVPVDQTVEVPVDQTVVVEATPPPMEPVTIVAKAWPGSPFETESIEATIDKFREEFPHITVDWQTEPQAYAQKVLTEIAAGTPADTFYAGAADLFSWVVQGVLLDLKPYMDSDPELSHPKEYWTYYEEEAKRSMWQGGWYGLGSCWVCPHLYTNLDLFEEAGVEPPSNDPNEPWTWDEFLTAAKALTFDGSGNHPGDAGFDPEDIVQYGVQWPTWWIPLHAAVGSNGGGYTADKPDGSILLDSAESMEAIQVVADLANVHHVAPLGAFFQDVGMNNLEALGSGRLAMIADGSWNLMRIRPLEFNYGTGVLPILKDCFTNIQAHSQAMSRDGTKKDATWQFVRFLGGEFYQRSLCEGGLWLPTISSLATPEGVQSWLNQDVHPEGYEKIAIDYVVSCGHTFYQAPGFTEAHDGIVMSALDSVWIGDAQAADVLPEAVAKANEIIEEWRTK